MGAEGNLYTCVNANKKWHSSKQNKGMIDQRQASENRDSPVNAYNNGLQVN